ncbi:hypothetical protein RCF27_08205 [Rhodococcus pyridinivorans]|uniref:hypothetical protein n=1 Tax=Rhodococcus pyridinivorans TaxID=103816 RepID=UPI00280BB8D6|nr:hypothetical protein [Rhodococcus pyridinivorans]WMM74260.1 hypothetical protein RCF27_08205 [Rhodococcus pyridinivorans]
MTSVDGGTADDAGSGTIDGGDIAVDEDLLTKFRTMVRAKDTDAAQLTEYLTHAKAAVDRRIGATLGIDLTVVRDWYLRVAADLFDRDQAPASNVPDRFGGDAVVRQQRSTRNPLQVIERELRMWVPTW